jgi:hypothetical protein
MDKRTKFLKIYANLPLTTREGVVVVLGSEPLTWNAAKIEIEQEPISPKSQQILDILESLKILK